MGEKRNKIDKKVNHIKISMIRNTANNHQPRTNRRFVLGQDGHARRSSGRECLTATLQARTAANAHRKGLRRYAHVPNGTGEWFRSGNKQRNNN